MQKSQSKSSVPLPERIRPEKLKDFVGQEHFVGPNGFITKLLDNYSHASKSQNKSSEALSTRGNHPSEVLRVGGFPSLIFWGPPGTGKTTLARIIANELKREFYEFSAVNTKTKEIEIIIRNYDLRFKNQDLKTLIHGTSEVLPFKGSTLKGKQHQSQSTNHQPPIIFIDEIHRFNKAQQDKLLPHVERGDIILIGATTENPSFEVIGPLLSRCRVVTLNQLTEKELKTIAKRGLKELKTKIEPRALNFLIESSNGDARVLLNVLEIASNLASPKHTSEGGLLSIKDIESALQRRQLTFDKQGEEFYNIISSYIKSMRASDVDAALYYLARMVAAGQDPLYIARRMVVFASEDVASLTALVVANAVFRACETVGYPECQENLAAGTVYLAQAKKDRSAYNAYMAALEDVKKYGNLPVPMEIRNAPTKLMKELGYGKGYEKYSKESLLPDKLKGKRYYRRKSSGK